VDNSIIYKIITLNTINTINHTLHFLSLLSDKHPNGINQFIFFSVLYFPTVVSEQGSRHNFSNKNCVNHCFVIDVGIRGRGILRLELVGLEDYHYCYFVRW
jgi:hypothetical protein